MPHPFAHPRRAVLAALASAALAFGANVTHAQSNPPVRTILPVSAGSGIDAVARAAQPALAKALGQPVVIENLPGAGGITGTQELVRAAADGNVIGIISNNHAVNPSVYKRMPYDGLNDITPISVVGSTPFVLVVNPTKLPAHNAIELQALLRAKPDGYNYASPGNGTILHLATEVFVDAADAKVRHIPYKGTGPMLNDLIGGQVEMAVVAVPAVQAHLKSGALRAIGVMGKQRVPSMPNVPTIAEQGFPSVDVEGWFAVVAPAKLPAAQVKRLHDGIVAAFNDPEVKAAMARQENVINPSTPEAARAFLKSEQERFGVIAKKAGVQLD